LGSEAAHIWKRAIAGKKEREIYTYAYMERKKAKKKEDKKKQGKPKLVEKWGWGGGVWGKVLTFHRAKVMH